MSGSKRQRQLAREKYERQQASRATRGDKRRRNQRIIAAVVVAALVLGSVAWVVISHATPEEIAANEASPSASASPTGSATPSGSASDSASQEATPIDCAEPGTPRADDISFDAPGSVASATAITFATNCGDIAVALDPSAPETVASMAFLAEQGYFDNTQCHRLTTDGIFVLQCGDPAGDGTGGPGYAVPDENLPADGDANYPAGTVAMANSGPGTAGSQFFIVYDDTTLPGDYTVWGTVTSGLDIVEQVAAAGVADGGSDGSPTQPVFIESATVLSN